VRGGVRFKRTNGEKRKRSSRRSSRAVRGQREKAQVDLRTTPRDCKKSGSSKVGKEKTGRVTGLFYQPGGFLPTRPKAACDFNLHHYPVLRQCDRTKRARKSLTSGEQKTKIIDDGQSPNNTETLSGTRTLSGSFLVCRRAEFGQPDCTNHMGLLCGLSPSDGAARTGSTWIVQPGCTKSITNCVFSAALSWGSKTLPC
jgi:hypothetical protein